MRPDPSREPPAILKPNRFFLLGERLMKQAILPVSFLLLSVAAFGQTPSHEGHSSPGTGPTGGSSALLPGMGSHHHPISTRSPEAQRFFDQGLTLVFGFNHQEAIRSFEQAARRDPGAAMPWWGIAYALGPNINLGIDAAGEKKAFEAVQKAVTLAAGAPPAERDYILALSKRYTDDSSPDFDRLSKEYSDAMRKLSERYPDDLDAATLFAESLMDLRPWKLWSLDGKPAEGTEEIVAVLESVLKRDPEHPGANHYYIHAVEASPHPERALPSARRLETAVPGAGHLVHMPAHIYSRTGDHVAAARSNARAAQADRDYFRRSGTQGLYHLMYYGHNLMFLSYSSAMAGRYADAKKAANQTVTLASPMIQEMPMAEFALPVALYVDLRFQRWESILKTPEPPAYALTTRALWHFARGVALASSGKLDAAEAERKAFREAADKAPREAPYSGTTLTSSGEILDVAGLVLDARIASARGETSAALESWKKAVRAEDALAYDEPPPWFYPLRESLGAELLRDKQYPEAERVFREDLVENPRNPRSLLGLHEALKAQEKTEDAAWVLRQFQEAWRGADSPLKWESL
jgi:tetratricopeptide (TPR) repeat protein